MINISVKRMPIAQAPHVQKALKIVRFLDLPPYWAFLWLPRQKHVIAVRSFLLFYTEHGAQRPDFIQFYRAYIKPIPTRRLLR